MRVAIAGTIKSLLPRNVSTRREYQSLSTLFKWISCVNTPCEMILCSLSRCHDGTK